MISFQLATQLLSFRISFGFSSDYDLKMYLFRQFCRLFEFCLVNAPENQFSQRKCTEPERNPELAKLLLSSSVFVFFLFSCLFSSVLSHSFLNLVTTFFLFYLFSNGISFFSIKKNQQNQSNMKIK